MTCLILNKETIALLDESPLHKVYPPLEHYPFPYDDAARVVISFKGCGGNWEKAKFVMIGVFPCGTKGQVFSGTKGLLADWQRENDGYLFLPKQMQWEQEDADMCSSFIHCALVGLAAVAAYKDSAIRSDRASFRKATSGQKVAKEKNDKYYILNLDGKEMRKPAVKHNATSTRDGSPLRYHMCRGHYRHLKSGKVVFVKAHYRGGKDLGIVHKDYAI